MNSGFLHRLAIHRCIKFFPLPTSLSLSFLRLSSVGGTHHHHHRRRTGCLLAASYDPQGGMVGGTGRLGSGFRDDMQDNSLASGFRDGVPLEERGRGGVVDTDGIFVVDGGGSLEGLAGAQQTPRKAPVCDAAVSVYKRVFDNVAVGAPDRAVGEVEARGMGEHERKGMSSGSKEFVITVAGKSAAEKEYVEALMKEGCQNVKLPEGATLVAYQRGLQSADGFCVDVFMNQLSTLQFGRLLLYAHQLPSTQTLLSQNCKTLPVGTVSVADVQFQGKGRGGNLWESPKGCLLFSFTLQMADGRVVPFLQYVVSLAVIEGIEHLCTIKGLHAPEVKIKWPNDLYANGLKVGGVLCTSTYSAKKFNIVVGVGLNVGNRQPTTCLDALLEEINDQAPRLSRDELLAAIVGSFEELFEVFSSQGFTALESKYYDRWLHSGQTVVLEEREEGSSEVSHIPLKIQGLTRAGYLRAVDYASETYELHPDGNSFDFLKGLVRKKM